MLCFRNLQLKTNCRLGVACPASTVQRASHWVTRGKKTNKLTHTHLGICWSDLPLVTFSCTVQTLGKRFMYIVHQFEVDLWKKTTFLLCLTFLSHLSHAHGNTVLHLVFICHLPPLLVLNEHAIEQFQHLLKSYQ